VLNVRKSYLLAALTAGVVVVAVLLSPMLMGPDASAQQPTGVAARPAAAPPTVALLDIGYIFKKHARMKAMTDSLKNRIEAAEANATSKRNALNTLKAELQQYQPGSPEYSERETAVAQRSTDLAIEVQQLRREFLKEEARIYHTVYQEIQQEVGYYCQSQGVAVVLRFSREEPDLDNPDSILVHINKPVVAYAANLDITDVILSRLNRAPAAGTAAAPTRPGVPY
jgi:Skp family chaperone for outer membrane proteins